MNALLSWLLRLFCIRRKPARTLTFTLGPVTGPASFTPLKEPTMADILFVLTDVQKVAASLSFKDAAGNAAEVSGTPTWTTSDPSILTVTPAADGLSAEIAAVGPLGTAQISVTDGNLTAIQAIQVTGSAATQIGFNLGTPETK